MLSNCFGSTSLSPEKDFSFSHCRVVTSLLQRLIQNHKHAYAWFKQNPNTSKFSCFDAETRDMSLEHNRLRTDVGTTSSRISYLCSLISRWCCFFCRTDNCLKYLMAAAYPVWGPASSSPMSWTLVRFLVTAFFFFFFFWHCVATHLNRLTEFEKMGVSQKTSFYLLLWTIQIPFIAPLGYNFLVIRKFWDR